MNINPAYRANELRYVLNLVAVKVLVMADQFRRQSLPEVLEGLLVDPHDEDDKGDYDFSSPALPHLKRVITISDETLLSKLGSDV